MKIVGGDKKKCPPIPKERGVGKKIKLFTLSKRKRGWRKRKKSTTHSIGECDWRGKEFFSLGLENHKIVKSFKRRTLE